ncbi:hypothetical protein [Rhodoferax sp. WC2427]|uniref:hypothetical protein n=1 Tax=Rhodoferax sp. WC2427 TaxID=3234144 RepID=UPI00346524A3
MHTPKLIASLALSISTGAVFGHEVPGLSSSHWHTSDAVGYCVLAALAGVSAWAVWRDRGGK